MTTGGSVRHETIEESVEDEHKKQHQNQRQDTADSSKVVILPKSINSIDYQQIVATLVDMRIELKLEIQKLTTKMAKIDDHISGITKKLAAINTPVDEVNVFNSMTDSVNAQLKNPVRSLSVINKTNTIEEVDEEALSTPTSTIPPKRIDSASSKAITKEQKSTLADSTKPVSGHRSSGHHKTGSSSHTTSGHSRSSNLYNTRKHAKSKNLTDVNGEGNKASNKEEEMRAILENEIAEQEVENSDDDQDLTSKL